MEPDEKDFQDHMDDALIKWSYEKFGEKTIPCTCCSEPWEESFFCGLCSGYETEQDCVTLEYFERWYDVCLNCCTCFMKASNKSDQNEI